jgi:hypothetical protein
MANFFSGLSNTLFGRDPSTEKHETLAPGQLQLRDLLLQLAPQMFQQSSEPLSFEPIAQQARQQFQSQTLPSIAERFTSLGSGLRSSGLQGTLAGAGAGLESALAAQGAQYGLQQRGQQNQLLQALLQMGLSPTQAIAVEQGSSGIAGPLAYGAGLALGAKIPQSAGFLGLNNVASGLSKLWPLMAL